MPKINGREIDLGGQLYVCPPIPLVYMQKFQDAQKAFESGDFAKAGALLVEVTTVSLRRNYPDLPEDVVALNLDLANMAAVVAALAGASGLERSESPGESATASQ